MTEIVEKKHAVLSPSGYSRWSACPGSVEAERPFPNRGSHYARYGTAGHEIAERCLLGAGDAEQFVGDTLVVEGHEIVVDMNLADMVNEYVSYVGTFLDAAAGDIIMPEQRVPLTHMTGEEGAEGTSDVVGFRKRATGGWTMVIIDLKTGQGVPVYAKGNGQLRMYAGGALRKFGALYDIVDVQMVIIQPPLKIVDDETLTVDELRAFMDEVSIAAGRTQIGGAELVPGEKQCKFCRAKSTCPALRDEVLATVTTMTPGAFRNLDALPTHVDYRQVHPSIRELACEMARRGGHNPEDYDRDGPVWTNYRPAAEKQINAERVNALPKTIAADIKVADDGELLAAQMRSLKLVEDWMKGVRAEVERRLFEGQPVPGFKVVQGKQGNRAWSDADAALAALKKVPALKIDDVAPRSVVSPTAAEKLLKGDEKRWSKIAPLITQAPGKPSVAAASDPRPEYQVVSTADSFAALPAAETPLTPESAKGKPSVQDLLS